MRKAVGNPRVSFRLSFLSCLLALLTAALAKQSWLSYSDQDKWLLLACLMGLLALDFTYEGLQRVIRLRHRGSLAATFVMWRALLRPIVLTIFTLFGANFCKDSASIWVLMTFSGTATVMLLFQCIKEYRYFKHSVKHRKILRTIEQKLYPTSQGIFSRQEKLH